MVFDEDEVVAVVKLTREDDEAEGTHLNTTKLQRLR